MKKISFIGALCAALSPISLAADSSNQNKTSEIEEIVVTASRIETPLRQVGAAISVITQAEIALLGAPSVPDILATLPGVSTSNSGGPGKATSVRIRGEEGYRTTVLVDGIDMADPSGTQVLTQMQHLMSASDIERIEVLRGPQGFSYGADAGGIVNIITLKAKDGVSGAVNFETGRYDTTRLNQYVALGGEAGDIFVSINDLKTNGFNTRSDDTTGERDGYENLTKHAKVGLTPNENMRVQAVIRNSRATSQFDNCYDSAIAGNTNNCESQFNQTTSRLSFEHDTDSIDYNVGYAITDVERESLSSGLSSFSTQGKIEKADLTAKIPTNDWLTIIAGADHKTESVQSSYGSDLERDNSGAFTELQLTLAENAYLSTGARIDDNEDFGSHTSARISGAYILETGKAHSLKLRSSLGSGFRAPSPSEIAYNGSLNFETDELLEEQSEGADIGAVWTHENGVIVDVTYFDQKIENEIYFDLTSWVYLQDNGISHSKGLELSTEVPLSSLFTLTFNTTYNETETAEDSQRVRRPKLLANVGFRTQLLDQRLKLIALIRTAQDRLDNGGAELENYTLVDISGNFEVDDKLSVHARVTNAGNKEYTEINNFNTAKAGVYGGFSFKF